MILKIFLFWRLGLFLITFLGAYTFPQISNSSPGAISSYQDFNFLKSWAQWDGGHYLEIAAVGYNKVENLAFFPLYPLLIRFSSEVTNIDPAIAGLVISNGALLAFLYVFYNFTKEKYGQKVAYTSIVTFLVFPTTFFTAAVYPESLFLLFIALTFSSVFKEKYHQAAIFSAITQLIRFPGIFLPISMVYSYLFKKKMTKQALLQLIAISVLSISGIALYIFYLALVHNDPLIFAKAQTLYSREISDPLSTIFSYFWSYITFEKRTPNDFLDFSLTMLFLLLLIKGVRKIPSSLWIFSVLVILIPASTNTLLSMPRFLLAALGVFIILAKILESKPRLKVTYWILSLFLQAYLAVHFVNGYWVA